MEKEKIYLNFFINIKETKLLLNKKGLFQISDEEKRKQSFSSLQLKMIFQKTFLKIFLILLVLVLPRKFTLINYAFSG